MDFVFYYLWLGGEISPYAEFIIITVNTMITINIYEKGVEEHRKWIITIPNDMDARRRFEKEVIGECKYVGPTDYYTNNGELGGYYINDGGDKYTIKRLARKLGWFKLEYKEKNGEKVAPRRRVKQYKPQQDRLSFLN